MVEEAAANNAVVCYTIVSPELRDHMADRALAKDVEVVDVLGPMLKSIEKTTGMLPRNQAGLIHSLDHDYFKRVEAVEFAVKYDDGKNPLGLLKADIVIKGLEMHAFGDEAHSAFVAAFLKLQFVVMVQEHTSAGFDIHNRNPP